MSAASDAVGGAYDEMVELYAQVNLDAMEHDAVARDWLARFAESSAHQPAALADLGCGPGHVTDHLSSLGSDVIGYDISHGQVAKARATFPDSEFRIGDLASLDVADSSVGGIVSRYSIIHLDPGRLGDVFAEWMRVVAPGAHVLVSFFGARTSEEHGLAFDHRVVTAHALFPAMVANHLDDVGFEQIEVDVHPPQPGSPRPFDQGIVFARSPE